MQNRGVRRRRGDRVDDGGQRPISDLDELERILGKVAVGRENDRNRLADKADAIGRQTTVFERRCQPDDETDRLMPARPRA